MRRLLLILAFLALTMPTISANVSFHASVSQNPVPEQTRFQVTFKLENTSGSNFRPPNFKGFDVLSGPSQSQSTSIINGAMTSSISYTYVVRSGKAGSYHIGAASIKADGKTLRTKPISVTVVKGNSKKQGGQSKSIDQQADEYIKPRFYARTNVSKRSVYVGEPVVATFSVYVHPDIRNNVEMQLKSEPEMTGFWANDIDLGQFSYKNAQQNGVTFHKGDVKKYVLLPQRSGQLKIGSMELESSVTLQVQGNRRRRSMFDDFFGRNMQKFPYNISTPVQTINVKALPEGAPSGFNGAVGSFDMKAWIDKPNTKTNEPVTLKIKVSGAGNLKLMEAPDIQFPPDFEVYDPKISDNISIGSGSISGSRTFEYLLIPRNPGSFRIDPVRYAYFDPKKGTYKELLSEEFNIEVAQGDGSSAPGQVVKGVSKEDLQVIGKDIRYIKDAPKHFRKAGEFFYGSGLFITLAVLPPLLLLIFFFIRRKRREMESDQMLLKNRMATKAARKRLATAKKLMSGSSDSDKFYEELTAALWGYLSDKLGIPFADLTKDSARNALTAKGVAADRIDTYLDTIDRCEFARFAPSADNKQPETLYEDAVRIITDIEGGLK